MGIGKGLPWSHCLTFQILTSTKLRMGCCLLANTEATTTLWSSTSSLFGPAFLWSPFHLQRPPPMSIIIVSFRMKIWAMMLQKWISMLINVYRIMYVCLGCLRISCVVSEQILIDIQSVLSSPPLMSLRLLSPFPFDPPTSYSNSLEVQSLSSESESSTPFTPYANLSCFVPANHHHNGQNHSEFVNSNALGLSGLSGQSSLSTWSPLNRKSNNHLLSIASHESLLAAPNPAYMQQCQRVSSLRKELELLQVKFSTLECVIIFPLAISDAFLSL